MADVSQGDLREYDWQEQLAADERAARDAFADWALIAEFGAMCGKARTTRHKYERCLAEFSHFLARFGNRGVVLAERRDVVKFLAWLDGNNRGALPLHQVGDPPRTPLSASTRKGYLSALRAFYFYCLHMEYVEHDPTAGIRAPKVVHQRGLTLRAEELQAFLDAPGTERDRIQAYLFVFTAQRAGALRDLDGET